MRRLLLVIVSLALAFLILEILCRNGVFASHALEIHQEASTLPHDGRTEILIVGDSFSVEDPTLHPPTFGSQLKEYLEQKQCSVLNISVPGYGPLDYLENLDWYENYASDFHPKLLIVDYYVGNDLHDTMARLRGDQSRVELLHGFAASLLQKSYLIQTLLEVRRTIAVNRQLLKIKKKIETGSEAKKEAINPFLVDLANYRPRYLAEALLLEGDDAKRAWEENKKLFKQLKQYAKDRHAVLLINIFPQTLQVSRSHYDFFSKLGFQMDERYLTANVPQQLMTQFCLSESILCNDLLPGFKAKQKQEFYMERDDHWNGAGFTLAYELVKKFLVENRLPN